MKQNVKKMIGMCVLLALSSQSLLAMNAAQEREELMTYFQSEQEMYKKYFDKDMLLEELDYDVDKIIDFVSDKIVYQAYDGVLRGVEGTLKGRAGNAHDQAITLASMLNDADIEAQIMVGKLSSSQIEELNQHIAMAKFPTLPRVDTQKQPKLLKKITAEIEEKLKKYAKNNKETPYDTNAKIAEGIYDTLSKEERDNGQEIFKEELQKSSTSYRWVRYKNESDGSWIEVHPAYRKAKTWHLKSNSIEAGAINDKSLQKLSMELWVENSDGEKHSITGKWTAPAANLSGKTLSLEIMSDVMLQTAGIKDLEKKLKKSHYFFTRINGELPKEGKVFDLKGNIYPGDTIEGLNTVFAEVGKKLGKVTNLFENKLSFSTQSKKTSKTLKKVWLEFSIDKPNSKIVTIKRVILEDGTLNKEEEIALILLQGWSISVAITKPMSHVYQTNSAGQLLDEVTFINAIKKYSLNNKDAKVKTILDVASSLVPDRSVIELSNIRTHFNTIHFDDTVSYPSQIQLLALRKGFTFSNNAYGLYKTMDILSNTRWSFNKNSHTPSLLTSIKHGVWETEAETYKTVKEKNIDTLASAFSVLTSEDNTYIGTATNTVSNGTKAWWEIDKTTGSTIGMIKLKEGYAGGSGTEFSEILSLITGKISEYFFVKGTAECINAGSSPACCAAINGALWAAGIGGGAVGAANKGVQSFGKNGAAIYMGIASVEFDVGTSYLPVTDICK